MKKKIILIVILFQVLLIQAEIRAIWATVWDLDTPQKIDALVQDVHENNLNQILAEVRYRGDTMYVPNRSENTYHNPEKPCYVLKDKDFDPLQYLLEKAAKHNIEIHAWVTVFVATTHILSDLQSSHIFFKHPDWITIDKDGFQMPYNSHEGAFVDPGIPEVQDYLTNVLLDLVTNYNLDGLHLDYIRYPSPKYGYNSISRNIYSSQVEFETKSSWKKWKEEQINRFVKRVYVEAKNIRPELKISAAVMANVRYARGDYSQNWPKWLEEGYLDSAYLMAYSSSNSQFNKIINNISIYDTNEKIIVGLRAWTQKGNYPVTKIQDKISIVRKENFAGLSLFYYEGAKKNGYLKNLKKNCFQNKVKVSDIKKNESSIYGYAWDENQQPIQNVKILLDNNQSELTDANGFFGFTKLTEKNYTIKMEYQNKIIYKNPDFENSKKNKNSNRFDFKLYNNISDIKQNDDFLLSASGNQKKIVLQWNKLQRSVSIYKKEILKSDWSEMEIFMLTDIVSDSINYWIDSDVEPHKKYQYQLISYNNEESNIVQAELISKKQPIEILIKTISGTDEIKIEFDLQIGEKLNWWITDLEGKYLLRKNIWYNEGKTIEVWNGITECDNEITNGIYKLYCFSETTMKEIMQTIVIKRK